MNHIFTCGPINLFGEIKDEVTAYKNLWSSFDEFLLVVYLYSKHPLCTSWVYPHPYFLHSSFEKVWVWPLPWCTACKKIILPLERVWVTPHPWRMACKVPSPKNGSAPIPDVLPGIMQLYCFFTFLIYQHSIFGERLSISVDDKVMLFHGGGMEIEQVINMYRKYGWFLTHDIRWWSS